MPTMEERKMMIQKIKSLPGILDATVEGLSDAQLDTPYREGGWTVRQVVHHLCDSHMNAFLRFKWMLNENVPTIKTYDQDVWATSPEYKLPVLESLHLLRGLHERWAIMLDTIDEQGWSRTANHPESGVVTLDKMLQTYSSHGEKHCGQILRLRDRMDW
ncbi:MAG: putative metal-dependent hydrolase [Bacteroidetes bacterium]|nr:putative metal-dependent hydrolase [Bacteroidota bacterium]